MCLLTGTVSRDFRLLVSFMNQFPPSHWVKLIHEKTRSKKSRDNGPLKSSVDQSELHAFPLCILQCQFYIFLISVFVFFRWLYVHLVYRTENTYTAIVRYVPVQNVLKYFFLFFRFVYVRCFFFYLFTNHIICRAGLFLKRVTVYTVYQNILKYRYIKVLYSVHKQTVCTSMYMNGR